MHQSIDEKPMKINEALYELCGDLPRWAIALRGLRRREGLTQVEMGKLLRIPQGNLSQMENGKRPIGKQIAKRLAELFKTDYRLFL
jgi:transcriptional regulator with XRE-family HTH domain